MQKNNKKKKPQVKADPKPFLRGTPLDSRTAMFALKYFGTALLTMAAFLILSTFLSISSAFFRILLNALVLAGAYLLHYNSGMGSGAEDVNLGEMLYFRQQNGNTEISETDRRRCYHPLKGIIKTLIGLIPVFIVAVILAVTAKQQYTGLGALPSWVLSSDTTGMASHALNYYSVSSPVTVEEVTRIAIRLMLMPWVGILDSTNTLAMLWMERLSPVLVLLPAFFYAAGYLRGPKLRAQVQTDIAANNQKRAKKLRKQQKQRMARHNGPEQLN